MTKRRLLPGSWTLIRSAASSKLSRSFAYFTLLLSFRLQTELATNADTPLPDIRHDVSTPSTNIFGLNHSIPNTGVTQVRPDDLNTFENASGIDHGVVNPQTTISEVRSDLADGRTVASSIFHYELEYQEGSGGQNRPVSIIYHSVRYRVVSSSPLRLTPGKYLRPAVN